MYYIDLNKNALDWDERLKRYEEILSREYERCKKETCDDDYVRMLKTFIAEVTDVHPEEHMVGKVELVVQKQGEEEEQYVEVAEVRRGVKLRHMYVRAVLYQPLELNPQELEKLAEEFKKKIQHKGNELRIEQLRTWHDVFAAEATLTNVIGKIYRHRDKSVYGAVFHPRIIEVPPPPPPKPEDFISLPIIPGLIERVSIYDFDEVPDHGGGEAQEVEGADRTNN